MYLQFPNVNYIWWCMYFAFFFPLRNCFFSCSFMCSGVVAHLQPIYALYIKANKKTIIEREKERKRDRSVLVRPSAYSQRRICSTGTDISLPILFVVVVTRPIILFPLIIDDYCIRILHRALRKMTCLSPYRILDQLSSSFSQSLNTKVFRFVHI